MHVDSRAQQALRRPPVKGLDRGRMALAILGHIMVHGAPAPGVAAAVKAITPYSAQRIVYQGGTLVFPLRSHIGGRAASRTGTQRRPRPRSLLPQTGWPSVVGRAGSNGTGADATVRDRRLALATGRNGASDDHPARQALLRIAQEQPGLNIDELARRLKLSRGATRYHLRTLIREGRVATHRQGHHLLHFPSAMPPLQRTAVCCLRVRSIRLLVEALQDDSRVHIRSLARRIGMSSRSVRRSIGGLVRQGLVRQIKDSEPHGTQRVVLHPELRFAWIRWCDGAQRESVDERPTAAHGWIVTVEALLAYVLSYGVS